LSPPSGYPTDIAYPFTFIQYTAPAWLDFVALLSGIEPPDRRHPLFWCELGCGRGLTAAILAATHPESKFYGIDLMPDHIESAQRFCDRAGIANLKLYALDVADAVKLDLPRFDYIVVHGVYGWVPEQSRMDLRRFIARHLAPSGLVYISYNAMPGWAADVPFQYLARALAGRAAGDSLERFFSASATIRGLGKVRAFRNSPTATTELKRSQKHHLPAFFPHEYLVAGWRAFYVNEVRADMATIDLQPIGSATVMENFDSFVLRRTERNALADITEPNLRELVRDYFLHQRFRRDVFGRQLKRVDDQRRRRALLACRFALMRPASLVVYQMATPAGHVRFDNPTARAIVAALADGPRRLADLPRPTGTARNRLAVAMALAAAGVIRPVSAASASVVTLNRVLAELAEDSKPLPFMALPCGTALALEPELSRSLSRGKALPKRLTAWSDFLASYQ
jgi:trans-aconitate methyltransferase